MKFNSLVYEWKLLNQGGIVDRYIAGKKDPVLQLADLDGDDDLDLLFGSGSIDQNSELAGYKYDSEEKRMIPVDRERKTTNSLESQYISFNRY